MLYVLLGMAAITGYLAMRTRFPLFGFAASIPWIGIMAYLVTSEYAGENWMVIVILLCVVMVVAFPLMTLGKDIKQQVDTRSGLVTDESSRFSFKIPSLLKNNDSPEAKRQRTEEGNEEYREKLHRVLHPPRRKR